MKRVLSSIGIGAATVDTILPETELHPGGSVTAEVELSGGNTTQEIEGIYFALRARHAGDGDVDERVLAEPRLAEAISLAPDDTRRVAVDLDLPLWTPITRGETSVWLETGVAIDWARDPTDEDRIEVVPDAFVSALFEAVGALGFTPDWSGFVDPGYLEDRPFAQAFGFRPTEEAIATDLDGLGLTVMPRAEDLRVVLAVDRRDAVADEHDMAFDEQEIPITIGQPSADGIRRRLRTGIERHS